MREQWRYVYVGLMILFCSHSRCISSHYDSELLSCCTKLLWLLLVTSLPAMARLLLRGAAKTMSSMSWTKSSNSAFNLRVLFLILVVTEKNDAAQHCLRLCLNRVSLRQTRYTTPCLSF